MSGCVAVNSGRSLSVVQLGSSAVADGVQILVALETPALHRFARTCCRKARPVAPLAAETRKATGPAGTHAARTTAAAVESGSACSRRGQSSCAAAPSRVASVARPSIVRPHSAMAEAPAAHAPAATDRSWVMSLVPGEDTAAHAEVGSGRHPRARHLGREEGREPVGSRKDAATGQGRVEVDRHVGEVEASGGAARLLVGVGEVPVAAGIRSRRSDVCRVEHVVVDELELDAGERQVSDSLSLSFPVGVRVSEGNPKRQPSFENVHLS